jgi:hypothetical protein
MRRGKLRDEAIFPELARSLKIASLLAMTDLSPLQNTFPTEGLEGESIEGRNQGHLHQPMF